MQSEVVVVGAGGLGRETLDVIRALNAQEDRIRLLGVIDSAPSDLNLEHLERMGVPWLGSEADWLAQGDSRAGALVAIGDPAIRQRVRGRFPRAADPIVHPHAVVGSLLSLEGGVIVCAGVLLSTNISLGLDVHIGAGAVIGHDTVVERSASIFPGAVVAGDVVVGAGATIGTGATVMRGLTVGAAAIVGAGACVVNDVPSGIVVKGVPAR